ncbi:biotin/lipoyl-binding protein, partial [Aliarcobacter butzleri]|uniref:biotin/lipoyl-binding protein n=1 Tax=Aliarcobacter butzleri TaxID=28197 RepID=UPI003AF8DA04
EIGIEVSGTLIEIFVDFNDEVIAGQILATIDTVKLQSHVDSSTAALAIAVANQKESQVLLINKKTLYDRPLNMYKNSG